MSYQSKNNQWVVQGTIASAVILLVVWLTTNPEYASLYAKLSISLVIFILWYFFAFSLAKKSTILVNENGIDLGAYAGPYQDLSEFNVLATELQFKKLLKHIDWAEVEGSQVGIFQRNAGILLRDTAIFQGIRYFIVRTREGYFVSQIYDSPFKSRYSYGKGIGEEFKRLGKEGLFVAEVYKF